MSRMTNMKPNAPLWRQCKTSWKPSSYFHKVGWLCLHYYRVFQKTEIRLANLWKMPSAIRHYVMPLAGAHYTVSQKIWGMHTVPHNSHKNQALWMKFGTVNRKSMSYNLSLKLLMQRSTSCSHRHDSVWLRCGNTSVRPSLMRPSMSRRSDFWHAYEWRDIILNIRCKLNVG